MLSSPLGYPLHDPSDEPIITAMADYIQIAHSEPHAMFLLYDSEKWTEQQVNAFGARAFIVEQKRREALRLARAL